MSLMPAKTLEQICHGHSVQDQFFVIQNKVSNEMLITLYNTNKRLIISAKKDKSILTLSIQYSKRVSRV